MKKNLLFGLLILSFSSCTKNLSDKVTATEIPASVSKKSFSHSTITDVYSGNYFDSCRQENIILAGTVTYRIKESFYNGYYLSYDINLKATGTGERSGETFRGGIKQVATVKEDLLGNTRSMINYRLKFTSDSGEQINFTQIVRFVLIDGETKLFLNNISDSCK